MAYSSPNLTESPADVVPIVLDTELDPVVTGIRVYNPGQSVGYVSVNTVDGDAPRVLAFPAGALVTELVRITRVNAAGTTPGLILHGYLSKN